jgi:hypothetical protein
MMTRCANNRTHATVTKEDIQSHFKDGSGTITEIKLMNGFGFVEYDDAMDARDVVPGESRLIMMPTTCGPVLMRNSLP